MERDIPFAAAANRPAGRFRGAGRPSFGQGSASALSMKWSALHDAAATVATICGESGGGMTPEIRNFPVAMRDSTDALRARADQGVEDLTAIMEPGLSALLAAHARGSDPRPAAQVLWNEFAAARDALMRLRAQSGAGPMRSA